MCHGLNNDWADSMGKQVDDHIAGITAELNREKQLRRNKVDLSACRKIQVKEASKNNLKSINPVAVSRNSSRNPNPIPEIPSENSKLPKAS